MSFTTPVMVLSHRERPLCCTLLSVGSPWNWLDSLQLGYRMSATRAPSTSAPKPICMLTGVPPTAAGRQAEWTGVGRAQDS